MTTGAATRTALRAAGARAATTGTTVHLPSPPSMRARELGVLAHEMSHVAEHTGRPRFLLDGHGGHDRGERHALRVGRAVEAAARSGGGRVPSVDVDRLPVGGVAGLAGVLRQTVNGQPEGVTAPQVTSAAPGSGTPGGSSRLLQRAHAAGAGTAAAVSAVSAPTTGSEPASTDGTPQHETDAAGGPAQSDAAPASPAAAAGDLSSLLPDLVEALQERVLADLERRGGRYAGVF